MILFTLSLSCSLTMDVALWFCDQHFLTPYVYPSSLPEDNIWRQLISLNLIVDLGGALLYLITASLSYFFIYDKRLLSHPQILEVGVESVVGCINWIMTRCVAFELGMYCYVVLKLLLCCTEIFLLYFLKTFWTFHPQNLSSLQQN